jgi:GAF domain-containing protein
MSATPGYATPHQQLPGNAFPFASVLSLHKLIDFWNEEEDVEGCLVADFSNAVKEALKKAPQLREPIRDLSILKEHKSLIDALLTPVFPPASWNTDISAAIVPFRFESFFTTPTFDRMQFFIDGRLNAHMNVSESELFLGKVLNAYTIILQKFYRVEIPFDYPVISMVADPVTGLDRYYKWRFDARFTEIVLRGPLKPLREEDVRTLKNNVMNLDVWYEILPPGNFEFRGFAIFNAVDVTDQEILSSLKYDLIEKESITTQTGFDGLQRKLRGLLRKPDVLLGLVSMRGGVDRLLEAGTKIGHSFVLDDACVQSCSAIEGSAYERAVQRGEIVVVDDLGRKGDRTPVENGILSQGIRNILLAPLRYHGATVGLLELGSKNPGDVNAVNVLKLREVLPLFATAINRGMEDFNNSVQAIIKEKCTAIHPSVEWRFRRAAVNLLRTSKDRVFAEMEPIVFENVYPLYGLSDIRDSSALRNGAIQVDLVDHLRLARAVITTANDHTPLPFLDEMNFRIGTLSEEIRTGLSSGDEVSVIYFLQSEVEPLFVTLKDIHPAVEEKIAEYRSAMDPALKILYRRRRDFEESVTMMNETISSYIDGEQEKAQTMFPHYFEKYKTDGVEHGIYIGAALTENGRFDPMYLKNLRLWQLMMMCRVVRKAAIVRERLPVPLETAHLILVQDTPLSIRFRLDEKKFDVDGAYNIRYEIMKKRIDKATVKGRDERLTQPGRIAIVYSQAKEGAEYRKYIEYLQSAGFLTAEVEEVELQDLQGIQGLKALRVEVNAVTPAGDAPGNPDNVSAAIKKLVALVN